ncbi:MAG TPA: hypothetical protein VEK37_01650 [Gemmatimonadaceae bacterium]|nr:hypothetical protein [Gemmatimonadaceae bacterium]
MPFEGGHFSPENVGRSDSDHLDLRDHEFLNDREIFELLIEVAGQQQDGVFQLAFAAVQRTLAEVAGHDCGADRDGRNQEYAAKDKPADRIAAGGMSHAERGGTICRHGSRSLPRLNCQKQVSYAPAQHMSTMTVWR